ncbi:MAG: DUF5054 domain-containing protein [Clostridiales bacterium]|nr:DUF5054 domain-containing protein [Clostridiales bacterium]
MSEPESVKKILILFKTHLDVGFTDTAANVTQTYLDTFLPAAIRTGRAAGAQRFRWSTGAWLIWYALHHGTPQQQREVDQAVRDGLISWHGLPFTTHSELMNRQLFDYGLSLSGELDRKFARKTIGAKMTDVPGHTKAIIPLLAQRGIEFLHLGVNAASPVPQVPPLFRWQCGTGEAITVMYAQDYGEFAPLGNGTYLYFAHTHDNLGAQSARQVEKLYRKLYRQYPGAVIQAGDLNDAALALRDVRDSLPVVTSEIGDSWIHGGGTDPGKTARFRAFLRTLEDVPEAQSRPAMEHLLMVPEHTWGLDEKSHLRDTKAYSRGAFEKKRTTKRFRNMEASWAEQRAYLDRALEALPDGELRRKTAIQMAQTLRPAAEPAQFGHELRTGTDYEINGWTARWDQAGALTGLRRAGRIWADETHPWCALSYEQFSEQEYKRFFSQYNVHPYPWAVQDFTKPGMDRGGRAYRAFRPILTGLRREENRVLVQYRFDREASQQCGCPPDWDCIVTFEKQGVLFDLAWFHKPANRMAEGIWCSFAPMDTNLRLHKLGTPVDPADVVSKGGRTLHGVEPGVSYDHCAIASLDCPLAAPGEPALLNFHDRLPEPDAPVHFNLYNNVWGTNFPMWYEGDARFRFQFQIDPEKK